MAKQEKAQSQVKKMLYRPGEAAVVLGTSPSWVYARVSDGTLKAVRPAGRMVRIRHDDLMAFIDGQGQTAA